VEIGGLILLVPGISWKKAEQSTRYSGLYLRETLAPFRQSS
jgi:hypothetical protein